MFLEFSIKNENCKDIFSWSVIFKPALGGWPRGEEGQQFFQDLFKGFEIIVNFVEGIKKFIHCFIMRGALTLHVFLVSETFYPFFCAQACPFSPIYFMEATFLQN